MKQPTPWQRLKELLRLDKPMITQLYLYAIFSGIVGLSLPLGVQSVIYYIQAGQITTSWIVLIFLVIGGVVLAGALQIMQLRITETLQQRIYVRYSFDFAYRFPRVDRQQLQGQIPEELMNRFFDIVSLQKGVAKVLLDLSSALLLIVFSLFVLSFYHPFYIVFSIALIVLVVLVFRPIMRRGVSTSLAESKHKYKTAYWLQEIARADWTFRLAPKGTLSLQQLDRHTNDYLSSRESHFKVLWTQYIWMIALKSLSVAALLGLGGYLVINQKMNLGQFVAAEILILLVLGAVEKIIQLLETVYDVFTSLEKLGQVQNMQMTFEESTDDYSSNELFPMELFDSRKTGIEPVLKVNEKDKLIVSGMHQQDATTLLRSLIDNSISDHLTPRWNLSVPCAEKMATNYCHIGWFAADTHPFTGTIAENILLGRQNLNETDLRKALETVGMFDAVSKHLNGFNSSLQGSRFSTNEMQRLLLARAIVHQPALLLMNFQGSTFKPEEQLTLLTSMEKELPQATIVCATDADLTLSDWKQMTLTDTYA